MKRYTVTNWLELSGVLTQNRGKKFALISMFGPRGKDSNDQSNQIVKVEALTIEVTE
jgi:hypothetical protein